MLCIYLFNRFFIFIWHIVYYSVISQKVCFYLVTGFKFFISKEIKIKIRIEKVFYSGNSSTKPCSKEDPIIINLISLLFHMIEFQVHGLVLDSNQYCSVLM